MAGLPSGGISGPGRLRLPSFAKERRMRSPSFVTAAVRTSWVFAIALSAFGAKAQAQVSYTIEQPLSLAWWQVTPHLNHLWATTGPADPSWRPGEGKSISWAQQYLSMRSKTGYAAVKDTIIPLYPRRRARAMCNQAVSGSISASDTTDWAGVKGSVVVQLDQLTSGVDMRDRYARESILQTKAFPTVKFTIDSLSHLTKARGDTLVGTAYGSMELHGVTQKVTAPLKTWKETVGRRVSAKFMIPAVDMTEVYNMSKYSLGLGVGGVIWDELWLGVDVILKPTATGT